jgi:hypothetical protein
MATDFYIVQGSRRDYPIVGAQGCQDPSECLVSGHSLKPMLLGIFCVEYISKTKAHVIR